MTEKWLSKPAMLWAMDEAPGVPARLVLDTVRLRPVRRR